MNDASSIANAELEKREFGITRSVLESHEAFGQRLRLEPVFVQSASGAEITRVFFVIAGQPYHFWIGVDTSSEEVDFAGVSPLSSFTLQLEVPSSESACLREFARNLPESWMESGQHDSSLESSAGTMKLVLRPLPDAPGFFDERLSAFLDVLRPHVSQFRALPCDCRVRVQVRSHQWRESLDGFHVSGEATRALADFRADLEIRVEFSGPPRIEDPQLDA